MKVNWGRGVRPPNAPSDFVEHDCSNPTCDWSTWVPPDAQEVTEQAGSKFLPVCSPECAALMADVIGDTQQPVAFMDGTASLLPLTITEMYAFIATDETGEGIPAVPIGKTTMPMVGADWERVQALRPYAEYLAKLSGKKIKLVKFTERIELEELG